MRARLARGIVICALVVSAVSGASVAHATTPSPRTSTPVTGTITVAAASSLTDVMPVIARAFSARYPGTEVRFTFAGSSTLVTQLKAGAPFDVLATASEPTMWGAVNGGLVGTPVLFAKNTMAIVMPPDNPAGIRSIADLAQPGIRVGLCDPSVPCGAAARDLLRLNTVAVTPVTRELDVRSLLAKVESGDLDAGIVYVTDARVAGRAVSSVTINPMINVTTTYPIATVSATRNPATAQAFVTYVRYSLSAQGILRAYGFARPW